MSYFLRSALFTVIISATTVLHFSVHATFTFDPIELNRSFETLGIQDRSIDDVELKQIFKSLIMKFHPDRPGGNEAKAKAVIRAFDYIKDCRSHGIEDCLKNPGQPSLASEKGGLGIAGAIGKPVEIYGLMQAFENEHGYVFFVKDRGLKREHIFWRPKGSPYISRLLTGNPSGKSIAPGIWTDMKQTLLDFRLPSGRSTMNLKDRKLTVGRYTFTEVDLSGSNLSHWNQTLLADDPKVLLNDIDKEGWELRQYYVFRGPSEYFIIASTDRWSDGKQTDSYRVFSVPYAAPGTVTEYEAKYDEARRAILTPANGSRLLFYLGEGDRFPLFDSFLGRHLGVAMIQKPREKLTVLSDGGETLGIFNPASQEEIRSLSLIALLGEHVDPPPELSTPLDPDFKARELLTNGNASCAAGLFGSPKPSAMPRLPGR